MKLYNSQQDRQDLIEWVNHDTLCAISQSSEIPQSTVAEIRKNPDKNATITLFRKTNRAIKEWKLKSIQEEQKKSYLQAKESSSRESLQSLIINELSDMDVVTLIDTYKTIIQEKGK